MPAQGAHAPAAKDERQNWRQYAPGREVGECFAQTIPPGPDREPDVENGPACQHQCGTAAKASQTGIGGWLHGINLPEDEFTPKAHRTQKTIGRLCPLCPMRFCYFIFGNRLFAIWIAAGPTSTTKMPGKMKSTSGKMSCTAVFAAFSSASCRRRVRIESDCTRNAWAIDEPKRSA